MMGSTYQTNDLQEGFSRPGAPSSRYRGRIMVFHDSTAAAGRQSTRFALSAVLPQLGF